MLVTKAGVPVHLLPTHGTVTRKVRDSKGKVEYLEVNGDYVRALFPDGGINVVNRKNLREVKS